MSTTLPEDQRLEQISARAFEHPADRAATAALQAIPLLDTVVRKLSEFGYERALRQSFLAAGVRLGEHQLPEVWTSHVASFSRLDCAPLPDLYLTQYPLANAAAIGAKSPIVVVNSRLVELLDEGELRTVLGHEAGHVLGEHVKYRTALIILLRLGGVGRLGLLAGLPLLGVQLALLEWFRAAELSADRAATLINRDPLVTCRTLMVLAGGTGSRKLNLDAFIKQGQDYEDWDSGWDRLNRMRTELTQTHSYPVKRVHELMKWVQSGEYDRIAKGEYLRRGQEPGTRAETSDAVEFYAERFRQGFREAGESIGKIGDSLSGTADRAGQTLADAGQQVAGATEKFAEWLRGATAPKDRVSDDEDA